MVPRFYTMRIIRFASYEMICLSRWGWCTFRNKATGKIIGFSFLGIGLVWKPTPPI